MQGRESGKPLMNGVRLVAAAVLIALLAIGAIYWVRGSLQHASHGGSSVTVQPQTKS